MGSHRPEIVTSWHAGAAVWSSEPGEVGTKAAGLLGLPPAWVPRFVVFRTNPRATWSSVDPDRSIFRDQTGKRFSAPELIDQLSRDGEHLLLRSNGPDEAGRPAELSTAVIEAEWKAASRQLDRLAADRTTRRVFALLQRAVEPAVVGQMSNERRFARSPSRWVVEGMVSLRGPEVLMVRPGPLVRGALWARSRHELIRSLRSVAGLLSERTNRYRCEWLWDGQRLWVVQADAAPPVEDADARVYLTAKEPFAQAASTADDVDQTQCFFHSPKLSTWRTFGDLGWRRPDVRVITGEQLATQGSRNAELQRLAAVIHETPVVVRTDVRISGDRPLLPTSGPLADARAVSRFMRRAAGQFEEHATGTDDYAFLLAPLVPARASAMVRARPDTTTVEIDALWGFPDGLLLLPHDSYTVTPEGEKAAVRHKPACLLWSTGTWRIATVGPDFDWRRVLARGELRQLASWGRELARHEGREIQLLALARIGGARGPAACLPFHYTTLDATAPPADARIPPIARHEMPVVRAPKDLRRLRASPAVRALLLRPDVRYLRDVRFLRVVGETAAAAGLPILFEGSLIGHAYYVLVTTGATVIPTAPSAIAHARRDTTPVIVAPAGGIARVRAVESHQARRAARDELADAAQREAVASNTAEQKRASHRLAVLAEFVARLDNPAIRSSDQGRSPFAHLPRFEGSASGVIGEVTDAPGDAPLFMDRL
jgi:hypothetical protein